MHQNLLQNKSGLCLCGHFLWLHGQRWCCCINKVSDSRCASLWAQGCPGERAVTNSALLGGCTDLAKKAGAAAALQTHGAFLCTLMSWAELASSIMQRHEVLLKSHWVWGENRERKRRENTRGENQFPEQGEASAPDYLTGKRDQTSSQVCQGFMPLLYIIPNIHHCFHSCHTGIIQGQAHKTRLSWAGWPVQPSTSCSSHTLYRIQELKAHLFSWLWQRPKLLHISASSLFLQNRENCA